MSGVSKLTNAAVNDIRLKLNSMILNLKNIWSGDCVNKSDFDKQHMDKLGPVEVSHGQP